MKKDDAIVCAVILGISVIFAIIAIVVESTVVSWVFGILAIAVFLFSVYAAIDTVVKNKRKNKDISELFAKYIAQEVQNPDFAKRMEEKARKRDILFDSQRPQEDDYGYSLNNPIMTSTISYSDEYLNKLRTIDGEKFSWTRKGSHCVQRLSSIDNVMVDEYELFLNGDFFKTIYICPYGHNGFYVPNGLELSKGEQDF